MFYHIKKSFGVIALSSLILLNSHNVFASTSPKHISVSGSATVSFEANKATVSVGVVTENIDVEIAQSENTTKMNAIIKSITDFGVDLKDIKTSYYYVSPVYSYENRDEDEKSYKVTNSVSITVVNINNVGSIIDLALKNGANTAGDVNFSNSDTSEYYLEALAKATKEALDKANTIAKQLGYSNGTVVIVNEQGTSFTPVSSGYRNEVANEAAMDSQSMKSSSDFLTTLPGELSLRTSVQMTVEY
jgi:uncharacterized protein